MRDARARARVCDLINIIIPFNIIFLFGSCAISIGYHRPLADLLVPPSVAAMPYPSFRRESRDREGGANARGKGTERVVELF